MVMIRFLFQFGFMVVLLLGLVGCGNGNNLNGTASQKTSSPISQSSPPAAGTVQSQGLTGQVVAASDVAGLPDEPLVNEMILAVPLENVGDILGLGAGQLDEQRLRFLHVDLPQAHPKIYDTLSNNDGMYTLTLPPGEYVLCIANSESQPPAFPARTRGCGQVQVQPDEMHIVNISSGFGEILLEEP